MENNVDLPHGHVWDLALELGEETAALNDLVWPRYLIERSDLPDPAPEPPERDAARRRRFVLWGIRRAADRMLLAFASAACIAANLAADVLPDAGWQFAIDAAAAPQPPNCLCLLSANVHPDARNAGFSRLLLMQAKVLARERGLAAVIAPVRPSHKERFPDLPIEEYLARRTIGGEIEDPWLRTHVRLGAEILNVCRRSVEVTASVARWREWTGAALARSGDYVLPMGLVPLRLDLDRGIGTYCEPNVWVRYRVSPA